MELVPHGCRREIPENCAVVRLERRPLVESNLLRNFSVAVEQTLIVLPCPCSHNRQPFKQVRPAIHLFVDFDCLFAASEEQTNQVIC